LNSQLPGYHGKGLYSTQGRVVYANNGDRDPRVKTDPTTPSGALAEWTKPGEDWKLVRRNQFTEVTGPGGIEGSDTNAPLWSVGWDARSLLLMMLDGGEWHTFRLPKVSHSYDGAHGWNTEWPRIREIGEKDMLMTMHGAFWRFPADFSARQTSGIRVRSAYLKVIGDFCRWQDRLVFGCDDSAKSEFLNKRKVKGEIDSVGQSQSNLWFTALDKPDQLGPPHASGSVWLHDAVKTGAVSDPFLVAGWKHRSLWLVDHLTGKAERSDVTTNEDWLRVTAPAESKDFSAVITLSNGESRGTDADPMFSGVSKIGGGTGLTGLFRARGENKRTLGFATPAGYYEMGDDLKLRRVEDEKAQKYVMEKVALPKNAIALDEASLLIVDDRGRRWRLPRANLAYDEPMLAGELRLCREVATERDMLNAGGTFYELPAENADGFAKIRPVASHSLRVNDFGGYRGLFLMSGVKPDAAASEHIVKSDDGKAALWVGAIDDLWKLGKPLGQGGPWKDSAVKADVPSDPYLFWGYDDRTLRLSHDQNDPLSFKIELDITGTGLWVNYGHREVAPGEVVAVPFEQAVQARWIRVSVEKDCKATAWLTYQ
jgi:hypothetical protein